MKKLIVILLALGLGACGYHLRGVGRPAVDFKKVYLEGASGPLRAQFKSVLELSSGRLTEDPKEADLRVIVVGEDLKHRSVSLNFSGRSNETELIYELETELAGAGNTPLPANKPIQIIREYFSDQQAILARSNEESVIRREIYQQAARTLLERAQTQIQAQAKK